ncbi:MAG TPA: gephyrin-like molybdotransferase Glp, partial [Dehalococcoidia bacterium]|nr:gephyrin-like molybdotransferase Glp [Dehalococcoidia bacterium]
LRIVADLAAGYMPETPVGRGEAVRIMTGAVIPPGANSVVPFEETDEPLRNVGETPTKGETVKVFKAAREGANVRARAEDVKSGDTVVPAGRIVRPSEIGVLASIGLMNVSVHRRPVVAILSTGDEITEPGQLLAPGHIYDSNAHGIAALVRKCGGVPKMLGIARDTVEDLTDRIQAGFNADFIVTSAGVSRGDFDVVKDVLAREGAIDFWTVKMKPGKPLAFGAFNTSSGRKVPHLGLPGNPVSSMVSFELFGRPAIFKMLGRSDWERPIVQAVTQDTIINTDGRRFFARCIVRPSPDGGYVADLTGPQGSGILTSMSAANALTIIPEELPRAEPGDTIDVMMIDWDHSP